MPQSYRWTLRRKGAGWEGELVALDGSIVTKAKGSTKGEAVSRAAKLAEAALSSPVLQAVLPPGAGAALKVAQKLGVAQKTGQLASALSDVAGPGAKRLAKALKFW